MVYLESCVIGGWASFCIGFGIVDAVGGTHTKEIVLYDRMSLPSLKEYSKAMHRHGAIACLELAHGGKYASARSQRDHNTGLILGPNDELNPEGLRVTAMTDEDIERVANCFADAAALCQEAGIDMVLIHGGHGWLLGQFSSPTMNHRTDKWGGSLENRMRFPLLVIEKIREKCGPKLLIEYRMSGSEIIANGYGIEEGIEIAKALDGKVDIIHVSAGVHEDNDSFTITHPSMFQEHGVNVKYAAAIKKVVKTPVATLGGLSDPAQMEEIIATGQADIIELARQSICDPLLPEKAFSGRANEIVKCCRCFTCFFNYLSNRTFCCAFNPVVGNELDAKYQPPATSKKKVAVVGGGPGGLMAALTAANRGHEVTLYEKSGELGGALLSEKYIPFKEDMYNFVKAMKTMLEKTDAKIVLNKELTADEAAGLAVDVIMVCVGAKPIVPPIPGTDNPKVVGLEALHTEEPQIGQRVVILGGGLVGCEVGVYLHMKGKDVTIVEMRDDWAADAYWMHKHALHMYYRDSDVNILCSTRAKEITDKGLLCTDKDGNDILIEADTVLMAAGMRADRAVSDSFYNCADRVFVIGDANKAGRVVDATSDAYYKALEI